MVDGETLGSLDGIGIGVIVDKIDRKILGINHYPLFIMSLDNPVSDKVGIILEPNDGLCDEKTL